MMEAKHICKACKRNFRASESYIKKHGYFCNDKKTHNDIDKAKISVFLEKYDEAVSIYKELGMDEEANRVRKILAEKFNGKKEYKESLRVYNEIGKIEYESAVKILRQTAKKLVITDKLEAQKIYHSIGENLDKIEAKKIDAEFREDAREYDAAIEIWEVLGEVNEVTRVKKLKAKERESARDYHSAIEIWESLGEIKEAARLRKTNAEMGSVKVAQSVVQGDQITEVKDSVLNRSNVGTNSEDKFAKLERLTGMKKEGLISDEEYDKMKQEIIG